MVVTPMAKMETEADRPHWGDLVTWQAAQSARRGAVDTGGHLIAGMLPQVDGSGRVSAAEGLCVRCGGTLVVDVAAGGRPTISGRARQEHCTPRLWWMDAGCETRLSRRMFGARQDQAFVGYALAAYARSRAGGTGVDLAYALGLSGDQATATLYCLQLYPMPTGDAAALGRASLEIAQAMALDAARLTRVLIDAQAAVAAEAGQRAVTEREREIARAREAVTATGRAHRAAQERLAGLLASEEV